MAPGAHAAGYPATGSGVYSGHGDYVSVTISGQDLAPSRPSPSPPIPSTNASLSNLQVFQQQYQHPAHARLCRGNHGSTRRPLPTRW